MATFDATPCLNASLEDLDLDYISQHYLPQIFEKDTLESDARPIKEQLAAIHLYDRKHDCPTYAGIVLFGKDPRYFLLGNYVQFVRFSGDSLGGEILNERTFSGPLFQMLPQLESFVRDALITNRPVQDSLFREKVLTNYPEGAIRELIMNACMHRDYQANMPIRLYQFDHSIEILNAGGLYGEARPENFPMVNDYRNPIVAECMKHLKYVNKFNRGIQRVREMLQQNGNPEAVFDVSAITAFRARVYEPSTEPNNTERDEAMILSRILEFCKTPRTLQEIASFIGMSKSSVTRLFIKPMIGIRLAMTIPSKPTNKNQRYVVI